MLSPRRANNHVIGGELHRQDGFQGCHEGHIHALFSNEHVQRLSF